MLCCGDEPKIGRICTHGHLSDQNDASLLLAPKRFSGHWLLVTKNQKAQGAGLKAQGEQPKRGTAEIGYAAL
jgi:hypothetical protein